MLIRILASLQSVAAEIRGAGLGAISLAGDIRIPAEVARLAGEIRSIGYLKALFKARAGIRLSGSVTTPPSAMTRSMSAAPDRSFLTV
jgi:hypothetical protein